MKKVIALLAVLLVGFSLVPENADAASADSVFVRLDAGAIELASLGIQTRNEIDYGSFLWLELGEESLARLVESGIPVQKFNAPFTLHLGGRSFDPLAGLPQHPRGLDRVAETGPDFRLVQMSGPIKGPWRHDLEASGLEVVQYIHPWTYVVWGERPALDAVSGRTHVRWTGPFAPAYRLLPRFRNLTSGVSQARALIYRGAGTDRIVKRIEALGGKSIERKTLNEVYDLVSFDLSIGRLAEVAIIPGVYSTRPVPRDGGLRGEMSDQVNVNNVNGSNLAFTGYQSWLGSVGLDGSGVVIANVDGGIQNSHPDLSGRLISCSGTTCGGSTTDSHGTHTAGIMAGDGSSGVTDGGGFLRGLGVAPGANLVEQVYWPYYTGAGGMLLLMTDSFNNGASLSGNSWGPSGSPQGYDDDTMQVDIGVRDADPNTLGNQPLTYVLSFMNGYGGTSSQGTPDEAKNIFNIGSTKMQNNSGSQILDIDDLSSNTAHGPALDGRTIPHMVAPGCSVDSTVPTSTHGVSGWCGTSMASPHVSGAVALFIEYWRGLPGFVSDPSPALIKAAFLPVARDLAGNNDADGGTLGHPFDSKQGWGRMDLEAVVDPVLPVSYWDGPQVFDNTGEEWSATVSAADPGQPLRVMLVWTDAPGHGLGGSTPAWNNDLDLVVEDGVSTWRGNNIGGSGWSVIGGSADGRNNTEGVFIGPTASGTYTIRVQAANIGSDGIPGTGDGTDQDFALVCYNAATASVSTISTSFSCSPKSGTVPFLLSMGVSLDNLLAGQTRRIAGHIDLTLASGLFFPSWRAGFTNVAGGSSFTDNWGVNFPALGSVIGSNLFELVAEDVTPAPFNQPPYPSAGDTDSSTCTVIGVAP